MVSAEKRQEMKGHVKDACFVLYRYMIMIIRV
jgi:hypothetical protein